LARKILLVDDAKVFLDLERTILTRMGAQLLTATNGAEALRLVTTEKPDIVLLDLALPDMPGDRICAQIKSNCSTANIPVVMVTGRASTQDIERCWRSGCDDFIAKPIPQNELIGKVARLLRFPIRQSLRVLVRIETLEGDSKRVFFGKSSNISITGMLLEADEEFESGDRIQLHFFLPGQEEICITGKVVRSEKNAEASRHLYGVQFLQLDSAQRRAVEDFIVSRTR
jgi:CheY-like chemotaxis protein